MPLVTLKFRNTNLALTTDDEARVTGLADRFNQRMDSLATTANNNATDQKIALMAALILEDELDQLKSELAKQNESNQPSQKDDPAILCDTLNHISTYLELLAQKIERR